MQHEVTKQQALLDAQGHIKEAGWARTPVWQYSRDSIKALKFRIKEWDYYLVQCGDFAVAFTISDLGYIGLTSMSFIDLVAAEEHTQSIITAFPMGKFSLGASSNDGDAHFEKDTKAGKMHLDYRAEKDGENIKRHISCFVPNFYDGKKFNCEIDIVQPPSESMNIATPWVEKPTAFYLNEKKTCMPASGFVEFGDRHEDIDNNTSFATLDWGRGNWTYDNTWYWGIGAAMVDGVPVGLNLGYGFSDRSQASENVIYYNHKIHKLDEVVFIIPRKSKAKLDYDFLKPWRLVSNDLRLDGDFTPILDRSADINFGVVVSFQHQVFGKFNGKIVLDDGKTVTLKDFPMAVECVRNKY